MVGVEPEGSRALHAALEAGGPVDVEVRSVAADSLGARRVGDLCWAICRSGVAEVALVTDEAIRQAQRDLWRDLCIVAEPGGAAAYAALASGAYRPARDERVGVLLCGANADLAGVPALGRRWSAVKGVAGAVGPHYGPPASRAPVRPSRPDGA